MLPLKLWMVWAAVFLVVSLSAAPLEEKEQEQEQEEVEVEATEVGELSEEEEDDDDSKSQDKIDEAVLTGVQQTIATASASGGSASSGLLAGGGTNDGTAGSSSGGRTNDGTAGGGTNHGTVGSSSGGGTHHGTAGGGTNHGTAGGGTNHGTAGGGTNHGTAGGSAGSDGVDSDSYSNGQKLLNGGGGGAESPTGVFGSLGAGLSHLDYTGNFDSSGHDFLLSLMGGGDQFGPDVHINLTGDLTPPTQLDSTVVSSGVTATPSAHLNSGSSLDSTADAAHQYDIRDQSEPDLTSLSSEPDQSMISSVSGSPNPVAQGDGADSPHNNGNGRQTLLTDANGAGAEESVTGLHIDRTAPGIGSSHDVTESSPFISFTHILQPVSGVYSQTELVTMVTDSTGTEPVSADPVGTPTDYSHPAVTDHTQTSGSVTERYHTPGQGLEGAENVELEDTC
ncbi:protein rtoA isoform X4 [Labrus bergylta]|uniref:protein rtoA isoform X4 n=1 Tax=Labrus bergylta TaxID=56723 RepID=UPI00331333E8